MSAKQSKRGMAAVSVGHGVETRRASARSSTRLMAAVAACLASSGLTGAAKGASQTWDAGAGTQDWNNAVNWTANAFPTAGNAIINTATGLFPIISANQAAGFTPTDIIVGQGTAGRLDQTAGTAATGAGNWLIVGQNSGGNGTFNISGGTMTAAEVHLGATNSGSATGAVSVSGSGTITTSGWFTLGDSAGAGNVSNGTLTLSGNGLVNVGGHLVVASAGNSTSTGKVDLNGGTINVGTGSEQAVDVNRFDATKGQLNVNGGTLNLQNNSDIVFSRDGGIGVSAVTLSSGAITGGAGSVLNFMVGNVAGNNTVNLDGGTLTLGQIIATNATGTRVFNFNGGTLKAAQASTAFFAATRASAANVRNGGAKFDTNGFDITVAQQLVHSGIGGDLAKDGGLTKNGNGTLTLTAFNTFTGDVTLNTGTIAGGADIGGTFTNSILGNLSDSLTTARSINVNGGTTLSITSGNTFGTGGSTNTLSQVALNVTGGTFQTGSQTGTGGFWNKIGALNLNGGTVRIGTGANSTNFQGLALIGTVTAGGSAASTIENFAASTAGTNGIHLGQNATAGQAVTFNVDDVTASSAVDLTVAPALLNTSGSLAASGLTKTGGGTLLLTGTSTYTGNTTINAGTLQIGNGNGARIGGGTYPGAISNAGTLIFNSTATQVFNGAITGAGALVKDGSGALTLGSTAALGAVTLTAGTLNVNGTTTAGNTSVAGGTTLGTRFMAANNSVISLGGSSLTLDTSTFAVNFNAFSPTAAVVSLPTGTLTLNGTVTPSFAGTGGLLSGTYTLIDYGTLAGGAFAGTTFTLGARALGNVANDTANTAIVLNVTSDKPVWTGLNGSAWVEYAVSTPTSATPNFALKSGNTATDFWTGDDVEFNDIYNLGAGNVAVTNGNVTIATGGAVNAAGVAPASVIFNNSAVDYTIGGTGAIGGSGSVIKNGSGTVTINTSNTYTGGTIVNAGRVVINNANSLGAVSGGLTLNAATLETTADITSARAVTLGSTTSTIQTTTGTYALNGVISGTGALNKTGTGTLSLGGTNIYTSGTVVNAGTLVLTNTLGEANNAPAGSFTLNNGSLLRINSAAANFNFSPAITINSAASTLGNLGAQINYTGALNGNGNPLTIANAAASVLYINGTITNISSYDVQSGTMGFDLNSANNRGTAPVNVANGAALWYAGNNTTPIVNNITFNGGAGNNAAGALYYQGGVIDPAALTGTITLAAGNTSVGSAFGDNIRLNGTVTGAGALTQLNANTFLNGNNDYSGGTTIAQKSLTAGTNTALGTGGVSVSSNSGAQLALANGVSVSNALTINGGGITGQGALYVPTGDATYTGPINITGATQAGGHFASGGGLLTVSSTISSPFTAVSVRAGNVLFTNTGSTYSALDLRGGTLKIGATNVIPTAATATLGASAAATLDLNGYDQSLAGLTQSTNASAVTNSATGTTSTLTTTGTSTYAGAINDGAGKTALTVASGTLTASGAGNFTGNVIVNGTLNAANGAITGAPRTTSPLGNAAVAGRTVTINNGGTVSLTVGNVLANGGVTTTPGLGFVVNAGGTLQTAAGNVGGPGGGDANTFGNITLNGGTFTVGNGYNADYQAVMLNGTITAGGTSASTINTNATNTTANGIMLGGAAAGTNAITFNVADATGNNAADLVVSVRFTNSAASAANPTYLGALNKTGAGKIALAGASTYGGGTTINEGALRADAARTSSGPTLTSSATGTGTVTVNNTGTLAGDGGTGDVAVNSGGTITAGSGATNADSIGTLHTGSQTWNAGGLYAIKADSNAANAATAAGAGGAYDTQSITGLLNLASLGGGNTFTLKVVTLGGSAFVPGSYKIAAATDGISYNDGSTVVVAAAGTLLTDLFVLNVDNSMIPSGDYTVTAGQSGGGGSGGDLFLNYAPAPEPGTLVLGALAAWPVLSRRRSRRRAAAEVTHVPEYETVAS